MKILTTKASDVMSPTAVLLLQQVVKQVTTFQVNGIACTSDESGGRVVKNLLLTLAISLRFVAESITDEGEQL